MNFLFCKRRFTRLPHPYPLQAVTMPWLKFLLVVSLRNYRPPEGNSLSFPPPNWPQLQAPVPSYICYRQGATSGLSQGANPLYQQPPHPHCHSPHSPECMAMMPPLLKTITETRFFLLVPSPPPSRFCPLNLFVPLEEASGIGFHSPILSKLSLPGFHPLFKDDSIPSSHLVPNTS